MNFLRVAWRDISSIFKNRFIRASVTAIIIVPLLYTLLYLAAFWDPYSRLEKLPVVVVNLDKGGTKDGAPINLGNDLTNSLKTNKALGWHFKSQSEAEDGLKGKKYYAEFIIPENFTTSMLSGVSGVPTQPNIIYHTNMKRNFLASQIINTGKRDLNVEITKNMTAMYTKGAFDNLFALKTGMKQAADGSKQLNDGIGTLFGYIPELKSGAAQLNDGVVALDSGIVTAKNGVVNLRDGLAQLNGQVPSLVTGVSSLNKGSSDLVTGTNALKVGSQQVYDGLNSLLAKVNASQEAIKAAVIAYTVDGNAPKLIATLNAIQTQATSPANAAQIEQLQTGAKAVADGSTSAATGATQLNAGLAQLNQQVPALSGGVGKLYAGSKDLASGLVTLNNGSSQLKTGVGALVGKLPILESGASQLNTGSSQLYTQLKAASDQLNSSLINNSASMSKFVSESVLIKEDPINKVDNYGTGFAPYFIALSLYVGAMLMFFVITDKVDADIKASNFALVIGKFFSYGYIGVAQAILASSVVLLLGLKPNNLPLYFLFIIFMSYVFIAIIQSLIFLLGEAGRMVAIALLILQLTASGGTFPNELVPTFFKTLNPFMPFTYAIEGLREIISGTDYTVLTKDFLVLLGMMVGFLIISVLFKGRADKVQERIEEMKNSMN